ncbi:MAG: hypothetical protein ABIT96_01415 [Ferruginibacter sp.]
MNKLLLPLSFLFFCLSTQAQNFTGQWKGSFYDKSSDFNGWGGDRCDYVLDLESNGNKIAGYSYTYFTEDDKKFYTICKVEGFLDKSKKYVEIRETERTKTNVPVEMRNCFQVHKLTYSQGAEAESLNGSWIPAPDQSGNCGFGITSLQRRVLNSSYRGFVPKSKPITKKLPEKRPVKKANNTTASHDLAIHSKPKPPARVLPARDSEASPIVRQAETKPELSLQRPGSRAYEKRTTSLLRTLTLNADQVRIDLYDNGEVDGDSISLFMNGKLLMASKRLSEKPITIMLNRKDLDDVNDLVMYAENLGTIPPNTALMVVTDGANRYEVRITSDLQKSGTIRFLKR